MDGTASGGGEIGKNKENLFKEKRGTGRAGKAEMWAVRGAKPGMCAALEGEPWEDCNLRSSATRQSKMRPQALLEFEI